jgi:small subunit ribosomal protein S14
MAKMNMLNREVNRKKLEARYAKTRKALKALISSTTASYEEKEAAVVKLQKLPRDSAKSRQRNRCGITGRSRGVYSKFALGRHKLREAAMKGEIPGLKKASW